MLNFIKVDIKVNLAIINIIILARIFLSLNRKYTF
jgi:hypothetical protein